MFFPSFPLTYTIELTYACNNSCTGCANTWMSEKDQQLDRWADLFERIAPKSDRQKYVELIRITGGEPTLHRDFSQIIAHIDEFDIPHAIFTCGRWKNPAEIVDTYLNCGNFVGMLISLHGSTQTAHGAFVQSVAHAFEETCENIRFASSKGIDVFTNTVLTKHSCEQIEEIIALSRELGAEYAIFNRFLVDDHPLIPSEDQLRDALLLIEKLHAQGESCRIGNCIPKCFVMNASEGANGGIEHCAISPKGHVRPNNQTDFTFGNIFEQSIDTIWQSDRALWYRQQVPPECFECAEFSHCRGGEKSVAKGSRFGRDNLMKDPIQKSDPVKIVLDPDMRPIPNFRVRKEPFGLLLTRYNWSVPVSADAQPILDAINGDNTLNRLKALFGNEALDFIGYLYRERCIELI